MAGAHIHIIMNALIWVITYYILIIFDIPFQFIIENGIRNGFWFVIGGIIFDLDHLLYFGFTTKPFGIKNIKNRMVQDYIDSNPHFYACHTIEFLLLSITISSIIHNNLLSIISIGWLIHMVVDTADYIFHYRSYRPWLVYFSFFSFYFIVKRYKKK